MKEIIIVTPNSNVHEGIGAYSKIKNDLFNELGSKSRLCDISNELEYKSLVELITNYNGVNTLYIILEFEINILVRKRPLNQLKSLFRNRNSNIHLSIMFHELWHKTDGIMPVSIIKNLIKRQMIREFLETVKPKKIFTNSHYNKIKLKDLGVHSSFNPIYSNIRVSRFNKTKEQGLSWLSNKGVYFKNKRENIGIIFGIIHKDWNYLKAFKLLKVQLSQKNMNLNLLYIGPHGETSIFQNLKNNLKSICSVTNLGLLSEEEVCLALAAADFGFCTTPLKIASRSGSLAALLEADLPVIISDNERLRDFRFETIGLPENSFWDLKRIKDEGPPIKQKASVKAKPDYRREVVKSILESL